MELYNVQTMPLSNEPKLRAVQEKILRGEMLSVMEKVVAGRDHTIRDLTGYKLKPDHCYRAVSERTYQRYLDAGFVLGERANDEYREYVEDGKTFNNNSGVDWFLGGVALKYGEIILECPADKEYFVPAFDNGTHLSFDPNVRHFKSSGTKKPIPMTMITHVFDAKELKAQHDKENLEQFLKVRELDRQKMVQLREQQLMSLNQSTLTDDNVVGKTR